MKIFFQNMVKFQEDLHKGKTDTHNMDPQFNHLSPLSGGYQIHTHMLCPCKPKILAF